MDRRLLAWTALAATLLMLLGFAGIDRPLAEWVRASGIENAAPFVLGLGALDTVAGMPIWFWLAGCVALASGAIGWRSGATRAGRARCSPRASCRSRPCTR